MEHTAQEPKPAPEMSQGILPMGISNGSHLTALSAGPAASTKQEVQVAKALLYSQLIFTDSLTA
jgi:hypothetical protein